ncbi:MAG: efflux RND transporter periplasmic adaptor subunit [Lachnospiraceae bacterium]|nr:efflux RND transporter periplasmic adaptor subunit [Lachnospiraceae bacterium]
MWFRHRGALLLLAALGIALTSGCGKKSESAVPVQSVAMICGLTDVMQQQVFAGVVSTGTEANIKKDTNKKVAKVFVVKGDLVNKGDVLFRYDSEQAQTSLDKAQLELEEQRNALQSKTEERAQLEADKLNARSDDQLEYTLKIQEIDTDIRETQYNIGVKEKEILKLEDSMQNLDVTAPFDGRIEKAGVADAGTADYASDNDYEEISESDGSDVFIKLVETDNYRVKGSIDESNINVITRGMDMIIHSRVDDQVTWRGTVTEIDYKSPSSGSSNNSYYGLDDGEDSEMTSSSKYPFYVNLDDLNGLMIGQHVYMTEDTGDDEANAIRLSSSYILDADTSPWVWAETGGVLRKRTVKLGEYREGEDTYVIEDGLSVEDYIAVPSDRFEEGMSVIENDLTSFETEELTEEDYELTDEDEFDVDEYEDLDAEDLDYDFDIDDIEGEIVG